MMDQFKQQGKDHIKKANNPDNQGYLNLMDKSSRREINFDRFSLGPGKGFISDKTLVKKKYKGNTSLLGKRNFSEK